MKKKRYVFLEKVRKAVYFLLLFNPLVVAGLCVLVTPWLAWLSPVLGQIVISSNFKVMSAFRGRSRKFKEAAISVVIVLHVLITLFAVGFTLDAIWPNLYANIWHGIMWLFSNYWIFIVLIILVLLDALRSFNLKALKRKTKGPHGRPISKNANPLLVYLKVRLTFNQLEKLEVLLYNKLYSRRIFKRYLKLATKEKALLNKERGEFVKAVFNDQLRIDVVFSFLEIFAEKYKDEENTKLAKGFMYELARVVNARANQVMDNIKEIAKAKRTVMQNQQINFAKNLLGSPVTYFSYNFDIEALVTKVKNEIKKEHDQEEEQKELTKKEIAAGNVNKFVRGNANFSEDLLKEFFDNLSLKKFEEAKVIEISKFKGVIWNNTLDEFFEVTSGILKDTRNDELISEIIKSIENLVQEVEQVGDDNLKKVIQKKQREMLYSISLLKK